MIALAKRDTGGAGSEAWNGVVAACRGEAELLATVIGRDDESS
jgi:hypothetical protein